MAEIGQDTVARMWTITLVIYAVVLAVVAALLTLVLRQARRIRGEVAAIWTAGQRVANNTIHIALLDRTNHVVGRILDAARAVVAPTAAITAHAEQCPACPACVIG